jgi:hypothetical protein
MGAVAAAAVAAAAAASSLRRRARLLAAGPRRRVTGTRILRHIYYMCVLILEIHHIYYICVLTLRYFWRPGTTVCVLRGCAAGATGPSP